MKTVFSETDGVIEILINGGTFRIPYDPGVAKLCFLLASKLGDDSGQAAHKLGKMCLDGKEYLDALRWFRRSLRQDPEHNVTMFSLAKTYYLLDRLPESKSMLRRLLKAHPDHEGGNVLLKRILKRKS